MSGDGVKTKLSDLLVQRKLIKQNHISVESGVRGNQVGRERVNWTHREINKINTHQK